jgi:hydrogenase maturation protease
VKVKVVGCGSPEGGDDSVGLVAVSEVRDRVEALGANVRLAGSGSSLIDELDVDVAAVVLVDAFRSDGGRPGDLVRLETTAGSIDIRGSRGPSARTEAVAGETPVQVGTSLSSHGLGAGEAVALAGALGRAPRVVFLGIEAAEVSVGADLSRKVRSSLPSLERAIVDEVRALREDDTPRAAADDGPRGCGPDAPPSLLPQTPG